MKYILFVLLSLNLFAFDGVEIEQLLFSDNKMIELNGLIEREKNPKDLNILREIKSFLLVGDMFGMERYIRDILITRGDRV
jgi:hypothetical protein